jgi:hypothetical protein
LIVWRSCIFHVQHSFEIRSKRFSALKFDLKIFRSAGVWLLPLPLALPGVWGLATKKRAWDSSHQAQNRRDLSARFDGIVPRDLSRVATMPMLANCKTAV